jgi:hypothetical protein
MGGLWRVGWLALALLLAAVPPTGAGSILREVWQGIPGNAISDLTSDPRFPNEPSFTEEVSDFFEAPVDADDAYGQRMHGYLLPPVTGNYTFWIASDDNGELWLSTDDSPANQRLIARVTGWTSSREWTKEPNQRSAPIALEAGKVYYIAALQKEGVGGDNLAVRWLRPDGVDEGPIPATYLLPFGTTFAPPQIGQHPADTTVVEGQKATFEVQAATIGPVTYQWFRNGVALPQSNSAVLTYGPVTLADDGARFWARLSNDLGAADSNPATLHVTPDTTRPTLVSALSFGNSTVRLTFSEPVAAPSATTPANYRIDQGVSVTAVAFGNDQATVLLTTTPFALGATYTITVNNVTDRAATPNVIAPNSTITFFAADFTPEDVGSPALAGSSVPVPGGFDVTGAGADIGGTRDQFQFSHQPRTGNFDIQARLAGVTVSDPFLHAGLMARESLDDNARFAAVFASSVQLGCFFESRTTAGGTTTTTSAPGGFPVNYPQTWLRLRRVGTTLTGFASLDGRSWVQLGSQSLSGLADTLYFGLAVSSATTNQAATARFRDIGPTVSTALAPLPTDLPEPLGPSSRSTGIVFSEIMYHPRARADGKNLEFVELYNARSVFEDLSGWRLSGDINFTFPEGFHLQAGEFVVIAAAPDDLKAVYGLDRVLGPYKGALNNAGGRLRLRNNLGAIRLEVDYSDQPPWPAAADGAGHSLVLARPSYGENDPRAWAASELIGGSPGQMEAYVASPLRSVVINEFLAHTDDPQLDFVELYNRSNTAVDLSGCWLTDDPATNRFRIPDGTTLPARGFVAFDQTQLGFALDSAGETIYLLDPGATRVLDAVRFGGQENGVASGRSPDGATTIRRLAAPTPGAANAPWRVEDVVINEIMFHPISEQDDDEFVELHNRSGSAVDVSGWRFVAGIDFEIPAGRTIPAGGFLVVAKNAARLLANYPQLTAANTVGDYRGVLANGGERIALAKPDQVLSTNELGNIVTNTIYIVVAETAYGEGGRWGRWADGGGSSLELIDPRADPLLPMNWADSDETQKAPWTTVEFTGRLDNGHGNHPANRLRISMLGPGECLVDDVEFFRVGSTNVVLNGGFEQGAGSTATSWSISGNHSRSEVVNTGAASGSRCLHVRAQGDGDTGINAIRNTLAAAVPSNQNATIRAKVRWLAGWPEVLFRTRGNWLEFPARMTIPKNLGTPGLPNSRRVANAGPAIYAVNHQPALPQANEPVVVTCRVSDPDGVATVRLRYRVDPATTYSTLAMSDNGAGGDAVAGDGIYSARLPAQASGALVAFRIEATDGAGTPVTTVFPSGEFTDTASGQECLVRWGDAMPLGTFAHYHLWSTRATEQARRAGLDNTYRDATLVYNHYRVIYNVGFRDKGSPWHGGRGDFAVEVPADDRLLGARERVFASTGNAQSEPTAIRSQLAAWLHQQQGAPYLHAHYIRLFRNGSAPYNVMEDLEQPDHDFAERWFPEGGAGDLYKVAMWFEFQDDNSAFDATSATLERFTTTGNALKLARYRWIFQRRSNDGTATNYTTIFDLAQAANDLSPSYRDRVQAIADIDEWMRTFSCGWIMGDWDMWSYRVGQNMYLYKQPGLRSALIRWDIDFTFGLGDGPTAPLWSGQDPTINRMYSTPVFQRMLWRAYLDAVNGPLLDERFQPQIDARRAVLIRNGISGLTSPGSITSFIRSRRNYILNQLRAQDAAAFAITSNGGNDFSSATPTTTLTGTAPFAVATIEVNGVPYPVNWTDPRTFSLLVPLTDRTNVLTLVGKDRLGNVIAGATDTITVTFTGVVQRPEDYLVINEIHYHPAEPGAEFVELFNRSTTTPFDLSGFRLDGTGYTFPPGAILPANAFLVLAGDRQAFANTYGQTVPVFDQFPGTLDNGGEYLALIRPGATAAEDVVISDVRYDDRLPWPPAADGLGPSLQLIDAARDTFRVGNWFATATNDVNRATPGRANAGRQSLQAFPLLWINEVLPNNVSGLTDAAGEREPWIELYNAGDTSLDLSALYLTDDYTNLTKWRFPPGTVVGAKQFLLVWADGESAESTAAAPHTSFRLNPATGSVALVRLQGSPAQPAVMDYLDYVLLSPDRSYGSYPDGEPRRRRPFHRVTPAAPNNPAVPEIQVTINEFLAGNTRIADPADGDFDDWFELYNAGAESVDLSGYTLTDDLANPTKSVIPPGTILSPGGFLLVWADEEQGQNDFGRDLHVNFRLSLEGEALGLFAPDGSLVDGFTFGPQTPDVSQGRFPDGAAPPLLAMETPTPGAPNVLPGNNRPPVLNPIGNKQVAEQTLLRFLVTATDADAEQTLTFRLGQDAPPGASIEPASGVFTWTPTEAQGPGTYTFTIVVTDSGTPPRSASERITVTVEEVNRPPALEAIADQTVDEGSLLVVPLRATDPDLPAQTLTFRLEPGAPAGVEIDSDAAALSWTPSEAQGPGSYTITVRVTDDGSPPLSDTISFRVTVNEANNPPEVDFIAPQTIEELSPFTLAVQARDPDQANSAITYSLVRAPDGARIDPATGVINWTPTEADGPGFFIFEVRATENDPPNLSASRTFSVEVLEKNQPPALAPIANQTLREGEVLALQLVATDADLPPQALTFSLDPGAPAGLSLDAASGRLLWPIDPDAGAGVHPVTVRVTDDAPQPASATRAFTITVQPQPNVVINEIMYQPTRSRAQFIELHNNSARTTEDLAGVGLTGTSLSFAFSPGTRLAPGQFLLVVKDRAVAASAYGEGLPIAGEYTGDLVPDGDTLRLIRRGATSAEDVVLDEVSFSRLAPWPAAAAGAGASLQLIDPLEDNRRVANWTAILGLGAGQPSTLIAMTDPWRYEQSGNDLGTAWREPDFDDRAWPSGAALLYVENAALPAPKNTPLTLGQMSYYFRRHFTYFGPRSGVTLRLSTIVDDGVIVYLNGVRVFALGIEALDPTRETPADRTVGDAVLEGPFPVPADALRLGDNVLAAEVHQTNPNSSDIVFGLELQVEGANVAAFTPGAENSVRADLPPFPPLWLNEVLPSNLTGLTDAQGDRDPWIELYNAGVQAVPLGELYLTDSFADLTRWRFPNDATAAPRSFPLVWADNEPGEQTPAEWHANFRLSAAGGSVALVRRQFGQPAVLDYVNYPALAADRSFGSVFDGEPTPRQALESPTPGAPNRPPARPLRLEGVTMMTNGRLHLSWTTEPGRRYRVEFKNDLAEALWQTLTELTATDETAAAEDAAVRAGGRRFYRIRLVE